MDEEEGSDWDTDLNDLICVEELAEDEEGLHASLLNEQRLLDDGSDDSDGDGDGSDAAPPPGNRTPPRYVPTLFLSP